MGHSIRIALALPALALAAFAAGCSGLADGKADEASAAAPPPNATAGEVVPLRIPALEDTEVTLEAAPGAACTLRAEPKATGDAGQLLFADALGQVRLHMRTTTREPSRFALDCESSAGAKTTVYELQPGALDAEAKRALSVHRELSLPMRPALSGDPALLTDAQVLAHGLPPRPDRTRDAAAYARWLDLAATPVRVLPSVEGQRVARPGGAASEGRIRPLGPQVGRMNWPYEAEITAFPNWPQQYYEVEGEWTLPQVSPNPGPTKASIAVGLDEWSSTDPIQVGTSEWTYVDFWGGWVDTNTSAWTSNNYGMSGVFTPNIGDDIWAWEYIGDSTGYPNANGGYVWYNIDDTTLGIWSSTHSQLPVPFRGQSAEWLVTVPSNQSLADFQQFTMSSTVAWDTTGASFTPSTAFKTEIITMESNRGAALCVPSIQAPSESILFTWLNGA